jgi:hypothetical protein
MKGVAFKALTIPDLEFVEADINTQDAPFKDNLQIKGLMWRFSATFINFNYSKLTGVVKF